MTRWVFRKPGRFSTLQLLMWDLRNLFVFCSTAVQQYLLVELLTNYSYLYGILSRLLYLHWYCCTADCCTSTYSVRVLVLRIIKTRRSIAAVCRSTRALELVPFGLSTLLHTHLFPYTLNRTLKHDETTALQLVCGLGTAVMTY